MPNPFRPCTTSSTILRNHYVNSDESALIHKLREKGRYKIIDKVSVELDPQRDRYWASVSNSNIKKANISDELVRQHEKILLGGIWAIIDMEYDPMITIGSTSYPFVVKDIKPIQLSTFDGSKITDKRREFTKDEWQRLLLRSAGYEPDSEGLDERKQTLLLMRLIPLIEANFNMVELGPRSSGKSYIYKEITPYALLISGGQGTVAKNMESGSFSRGGKGGEIAGHASIIYNGNINQPVETVLQTSHLFSPLSDEVNYDTAFLGLYL